MKKTQRIVFFGGIGRDGEFGGETSKNREILDRLKELGYDVEEIDTFHSNSSLLRLAKVGSRLLKNLIFHSGDAFVFSTSFINLYPIVKVLSRWPVKLNLTYWTIGGQFADRVADGTFDARYIKVFDHILLEGEPMRRTLERTGISSGRVVPNFKTLPRLPKPVKPQGAPVRFLFLSRIMPEKGVRLIMEAVDALRSWGISSGDYEIDFYGYVDKAFASEYHAWVERTPEVNHKGTIQLLEPENYAKLLPYHFMLFPTFWSGEGFPGVIVDAFIAGLPILASEWNLNSEFVKHGVNGLLFPPHDSAALASAMRQAIEIHADKEKYSSMVDDCLKRAPRFDTRAVVTPELIESIL